MDCSTLRQMHNPDLSRAEDSPNCPRALALGAVRTATTLPFLLNFGVLS